MIKKQGTVWLPSLPHHCPGHQWEMRDKSETVSFLSRKRPSLPRPSMGRCATTTGEHNRCVPGYTNSRPSMGRCATTTGRGSHQSSIERPRITHTHVRLPSRLAHNLPPPPLQKFVSAPLSTSVTDTFCAKPYPTTVSANCIQKPYR